MGTAIGISIGVGLAALGLWLLLYGLTQPIYCEGGTYRGGCGNIPEIVGGVIALAGIAIFSGAIIYGMKTWEDSDSELPDD